MQGKITLNLYEGSKITPGKGKIGHACLMALAPFGLTKRDWKDYQSVLHKALIWFNPLFS
jgi:hypothetical protein